MRRGVLIVAATLVCLLAGLFSAAVLAATGPLGGVAATTTTTQPPPTPTPPPGPGATARTRLAIDQARRAAPHTRVLLFVTLRAGRVGNYVKALARRFDRPAQDAELTGLRRLRPWITKEPVGKELKQRQATRRIVAALRTHQRTVRIRATR